jgi:hypothetical protein
MRITLFWLAVIGLYLQLVRRSFTLQLIFSTTSNDWEVDWLD